MTILKLRMLRIDKGLSVEALSKEANVSAYTLRSIEQEGHLPSPATALKIATVFGLKPTELFPELIEDRSAA